MTASTHLPGLVFPGQVTSQKIVCRALAGYADDPLVAAMLRQFGVTSVGQLDFSDSVVAQSGTYVAGLLSARKRIGPSAPVPMVLGHSIGEITALVFAGAIDPIDGLELMWHVGQMGREQSLLRSSALVAVMGLGQADADWVCRRAAGLSGGVLEPSSFNSPTQTVFCGDRKAAEAAVRLVTAERGAIARILPIRGAYHSSLMADVLPRWIKAVHSVELRDPRVPVMSSIDGRSRTAADGLTELLIRWLVLPVHWTRAVEEAARSGVTTLWDAGPGKVLEGLGRRSSVGFVRFGEGA